MDKRRIIQYISAVVINLNYKGFIKGTILRSRSKGICLPVLNCYSCPGALGSCPIGAFQAVLLNAQYRISLFVIGTLTAVGALIGRMPCGYLCPFGLFQDIASSFRKKLIKIKSTSPAVYIKYILGIIFVAVLPLVLTGESGIGSPQFCKWICPQGTLSAGLPLISVNPKLRALVSTTFIIKILFLALLTLSAVFISRPFCRFFCPLGAILGQFNRFSAYRLTVDNSTCISCGKCEKICPMGIYTKVTPNSPECIRCGKCIGACPTHSISSKISLKGEIGNNEKNKKNCTSKPCSCSCNSVCGMLKKN